MPRPTGRGYALLALAVLTYLVARVLGTWELYLLSLAFPAVVLLCWLMVVFSGRRIRSPADWTQTVPSPVTNRSCGPPFTIPLSSRGPSSFCGTGRLLSPRLMFVRK